jgi:hypothetical protein
MTSQPEDIRKEPLIAKKWDFNSVPASNLAEGLLITGPSSYIGSHIVAILQETWAGQISLLLRASSRKEACQKMEEAFVKWQLGKFNEEKFEILTGDVCANSLGLSQRIYKRLNEETGRVVHLAMTPMYHLPFQHFKRVWIPELEKMISFCGTQGAPKSLHYASSFNANFFTGEKDFEAVNTNAWQSGYAGFKWVANKALNNAFDQNLNGCIYDIPLVLGSERKGICPRHYSIWLILDIFLKTKRFFKFEFPIIPVDVLAEIIVFNLLREVANEGKSFVRPVLREPVTDQLFSQMVASILGLKEGGLKEIRDLCQNKLRFDFMVPPNFYELLEKVHGLGPVLPDGYDPAQTPSTPLVFMSNLNHILARNTELKVES